MVNCIKDVGIETNRYLLGTYSEIWLHVWYFYENIAIDLILLRKYGSRFNTFIEGIQLILYEDVDKYYRHELIETDAANIIFN